MTFGASGTYGAKLADGECYTKEQIEKDGLAILSRTISKLFFETRRKKEIALQAVEAII